MGTVDRVVRSSNKVRKEVTLQFESNVTELYPPKCINPWTNNMELTRNRKLIYVYSLMRAHNSHSSKIVPE